MKHYSTYQSQFIEMFASYEMMSNFGDFFSSARNGANIKQGTISGGIPITRIETISDGEVNRDKMGYAGITDNTYSSYYLQDGDILVSHINSMKHIGKCALYQRINDEIIIHGMNLLCLRPCKDVVNPVYVTYLLRSSIMRKLILDITKPAVNQVSFTVKDLCKLKVMLPPISEQEKFAAIVHQADKSKFTHLKSQFIEMFGTLDEPRVEVKRLRDIVVSSGQYGSNTPATDYELGMPRYIRITDINDDGSLNDDIKGAMGMDPKYKLLPGDIVFARTGATVGKTYMHKSGDAIYAGYLIKYQMNLQKIRPTFLMAYTHSRPYYNWVSKTQKVGAQPNISAAQYDSMPVLVPTVQEQDTFLNIYHQADKSKFELRKSIDAIDQVIKSLINN